MKIVGITCGCSMAFASGVGPNVPAGDGYMKLYKFTMKYDGGLGRDEHGIM
jgi:hypothetical protein